MCDLRQDDNLVTDHYEDFSLMNSRLHSFQGSSLAQQVPAERLARAGFYFTGQADRVRCFSCRKTVENWCRGDTPVERHKEVSPTCTYLRCTHGPSGNSMSSTTVTNGSPNNEVAESMEFLLRTGAVVDESTYPLFPHMRREEARLQTFSAWPASAPVRPADLAEAGLFYLGQRDLVQCFCCAGRLYGWEPGDTAWGEHSKHYHSNCLFILGHDVGNIPLQGGTMEEEQGSSRRPASTRVPMGSFEERLNSFAGVQHPLDSERLARAGFYSTGTRDNVMCFRCGGGLKSWQPDEDPWEQHAKHYPGCNFLLEEKGQAFINNVQLQDPQQNSATASPQNGLPEDRNEMLQSALVQKAVEMGMEPSVVERTILEKINRTGSSYSSLEALMEDCFNNTPQEDTQEQDEDPLEKLRKLQREKQCKICMDRDCCMVFLPCRHLVTCQECSALLDKCPICCGVITEKIQTYIA